MNFFYVLVLILVGFSSGIIISGAVFAFITSLGIVQRLAKTTSTEKFCKLYEEIIFLWKENIPISIEVENDSNVDVYKNMQNILKN